MVLQLMTGYFQTTVGAQRRKHQLSYLPSPMVLDPFTPLFQLGDVLSIDEVDDLSNQHNSGVDESNQDTKAKIVRSVSALDHMPVCLQVCVCVCVCKYLWCTMLSVLACLCVCVCLRWFVCMAMCVLQSALHALTVVWHAVHISPVHAFFWL